MEGLKLRTVVSDVDTSQLSLTLVKVHPGKKYSTMVIETIITRNNTHTTMVRAEGLEHDLRHRQAGSTLLTTNRSSKDVAASNRAPFTL